MDYKRLKEVLGKKGIRIKDGRIRRKDALAIVKIVHSENEWEKKFRENEGAPEDMLKKAEKASKEGHWLARYVDLANITGSEWADEMTSLQSIYDKFGAKPQGLMELSEELMGSIIFNLVDKEGWNKLDLERISWGLPGRAVETYRLERPTGTPKEKENN